MKVPRLMTKPSAQGIKAPLTKFERKEGDKEVNVLHTRKEIVIKRSHFVLRWASSCVNTHKSLYSHRSWLTE